MLSMPSATKTRAAVGEPRVRLPGRWAPIRTRAGDDPRGALHARAAQARYPVAQQRDLIEEATTQPYSPPNLRPSAIVNVAGVNVGLVGLLTLETTHFVLASLFAGLRLDPLVDVLTRERRRCARRARPSLSRWRTGGSCKAFDELDDLGSCDRKSEIFQVAEAVPAGTVDAIVAGHTHQRLSHRVNGIPIIEAGEHGEYLARVDLVIDPETNAWSRTSRIRPSRCARVAQGRACAPQTYEGAPVVEDPGGPYHRSGRARERRKAHGHPGCYLSPRRSSAGGASPRSGTSWLTSCGRRARSPT